MPRLSSPDLDLAALAATPQPDLEVPAVGARLRQWGIGHAPAVRQVYADPAVRHWHCRTLDSDAEARELIGRWRSGWPGDRIEWAVVDAGDELGRVAVKTTDPDGVADLGYWTVPRARGRGVTPAAVEVASTWAFDVGYHRLQLVHSTQNSASCRAATKAGFHAEATLRASVLHTDGWHDMHQHARFAAH